MFWFYLAGFVWIALGLLHVFAADFESGGLNHTTLSSVEKSVSGTILLSVGMLLVVIIAVLNTFLG